MRIFLPAMALLLWSGTALAEDLPSSAVAPRAPTTAVATSPEVRPMVSQGDPAVSSIRMGDTTVKRSGCLALSLYDALVNLNQLAPSMDPGAFVKFLSSYGLFTKSGRLRWDFGSLFPVWVERKSAEGISALSTAQNLLASGAQVLLEVVTHRGTTHWVVLTRVDDGDAEIRDPNGGRTTRLDSSYGVSSIRGYAAIMAH